MGDPARGQRRIRLRDGGCAGSLRTALRPAQAPYLPRRMQQATGRRNPPAEPGRAERHDYEYERRSTADLFMLSEPLAGKRHVKVTERRTAVDFAHVIRDLLDVHYPEAETLVLVMDNLNTHRLASLYQGSPHRKEKIVRLFELSHFHYFGRQFAPRRSGFSVQKRRFMRHSTTL